MPCCNSLCNTSTTFWFSFQRHVQLCLGCLAWKNDPVCPSWIFFATIHNRCHWWFCYYRYLMAFCNHTSHSWSWKFCSLGHRETLHSYSGVSLHSKIAPATEDTQGSTAPRPAAQPHSLHQRSFKSWKCPGKFYFLWPKMAVICSLFPGNPRRHRQLSSNILHPNLSLLGPENSHWAHLGREFTPGSFDFVTGNGMFVPLLH